MQKKEFIDIIAKYQLKGNCNAVKWTVLDKNLTVNFMTEEGSMLGTLEANVDMEDAEIGIKDTTKLINLMGALESDFSIKLHYEGKVLSGIRLKDEFIDMTFVLSDLSNIPVPRSLKSVPEFDLEIDLDKDFISRFVKARKALKDPTDVGTKLVAISTTDQEVDFIINYSDLNENRITLTSPAKVHNQINFMAFNVDLVSSVFSVNSDYRVGTLKVSDKGLAMFEFIGEDYTCKYYLKNLSV